MKELSTEQKAKAYDNLIERLKDFQFEYKFSAFSDTIEKYLPELAESEDERIRKDIMHHIEFEYNHNTIPHQRAELWIAWLEKQGEQKSIDKIQLGKKYKCIASPRYSTFIRGEIYKPEDKFLCSLMNFCSDCFEPIEDSEQKPADKVEPKFKVGQTIIYKGTENIAPTKMTISDIANGQYWDDNCCIVPISDQDNWELVEQKPIEDRYMEGYLNGVNDASKTPKSAVWSEEDEENLNWFEKFFRAESVIAEGKDIPQDRYLWFKNLKDRVQPKQEWSEEDEDNRIDAIKYLELFDAQGIHGNVAIPCIDWLKSLKPRSQWKPSYEQIEAIKDAIEFLGCTKKVREDLKSLYEQLKKLREEDV